MILRSFEVDHCTGHYAGPPKNVVGRSGTHSPLLSVQSVVFAPFVLFVVDILHGCIVLFNHAFGT
jgi:hypothetical protein